MAENEGLSSEHADEREEEQDLASQYPRVDNAFQFVLPSYDWAHQRFAALDTRIQQISLMSATLTVGAPLIAKAVAPTADLTSAWVLGALGLGSLVVVLGAVGQTLGGLRQVSLAKLYQRNLHKTEWTFQKDLVHLAAKNQRSNLKAIQRRGRLASVLSAGIAGQVICLAVWIALHVLTVYEACHPS